MRTTRLMPALLIVLGVAACSDQASTPQPDTGPDARPASPTELPQARLDRLYGVVSGMPMAMWYTVVLGAILNFVLLRLFDLRRGNLLLLGGLIAFFTGTLICLIAMLDNSYRGDVSVSPEALELAYEQLFQN